MNKGNKENKENKGDWKSYAYVFAILIASMLMRALIGSWKPTISWEQSALIGVTTVLLAAPPIYHFFYKEDLIPPKKMLPYGFLSFAAAGLFLYYVAL